MTLLNGYKEEIRIRKNRCVVNIMKYHRKMLYGRVNVSLSGIEKEKDDFMLKVVNEEIMKLLRHIE